MAYENLIYNINIYYFTVFLFIMCKWIHDFKHWLICHIEMRLDYRSCTFKCTGSSLFHFGPSLMMIQIELINYMYI